MDAFIRQALQDGEKLGARYGLEIPQVAPSGSVGSRLGRRAGTSIDFQDYREYQQGDDLRFVDWSVYGRTDRMAVKLFREEVTPHLDIVVDGSRSMNLEETSKAQGAATIAAVLAAAATNSQCSQAVWLSGEGFQRLPNDSHSPSSWDNLEFASKRTLDEAFSILSPRLRRLGMRVLISDLLWPGNPAQTVRRLSDGAAALFVIQVVAREDLTPPAHGNLRLVDSETDEESEIYVDSTVEKQYRENVAQWQQSWDDACRQCGAHMVTMVAGEFENSMAALESAHLLVPA